jgi:hypothetical protein
MKGAKGLARIPVIVAVLVVAAGGASIQGKLPVTFAESNAPATETVAPAGDVPFIGEMTVTADRISN